MKRHLNLSAIAHTLGIPAAALVLPRLPRACFLSLAAASCTTSHARIVEDAAPTHSIRDAAQPMKDAHGPDVEFDGSSSTDASMSESGANAAPPLLRLGNWSPDGPGLDLCLAPHGSSLWSGPLLASAFGTGVLGALVVVDEKGSGDGGVRLDGAPGIQEAGGDAMADADSFADGGGSDAPRFEAGAAVGVTFPRLSPYLQLEAGQYDVRVVLGGAPDCTAPVLADRTDFAPIVAGSRTTLAVVGEFAVQGTDSSAGLIAIPDDAEGLVGQARVRLINAVPSVTQVSLVDLGIHFDALVSDVPFGAVGVDTDAGLLDSNDYLATAPTTDATWFLINGNGTNTVLAGVYRVVVPAGQLTTVVAVGGASGPTGHSIGVLLCNDAPPIGPGEYAACTLIEGPGTTSPVCPRCREHRPLLRTAVPSTAHTLNASKG